MLIFPRILSLAHCFTFVIYLSGDILFTHSMLSKRLTFEPERAEFDYFTPLLSAVGQDA